MEVSNSKVVNKVVSNSKVSINVTGTDAKAAFARQLSNTLLARNSVKEEGDEDERVSTVHANQTNTDIIGGGEAKAAPVGGAATATARLSESPGSVKSYSEDLWDCFEKVVERLTQGKNDLKMVNNFYEAIAHTEMQYAKGLQKADNIAKDFVVSSSLQGAFVQVRSHIKGLSKLRENTSLDISKDISAKVASVCDEIRDEVQRKQTHYKDLHKELDALTSSHKRKKTRYRDAVQKATEAHNAMQEGKKKGKSAKELNKLAKELEKCKKNEDHLEEKLQLGVLKLSSHQTLVLRETRVMLSELEKLDRLRSDTFREVTSFYLKLLGDNAAFETVGVDIQKRALAKTDTDKDVQDYISKNETHKIPPPLVTFEKKPSDAPTVMTSSLGGLEASTLRVKRLSSRASGLDPDSRMDSYVESYSEADVYVDLHAAQLSDRIAVALSDFKSEEKGEFSFRKGDQFDIDAADGEDWWTGTHRGRTGEFPAGLVRVQCVGHGVHPVDMQAEAQFDFESENNDELTLKKGDIVHVSLVCNGWCVGKIIKTHYGVSVDAGKAGIFPVEWVKIKGF